jgi:hypothetical protein
VDERVLLPEFLEHPSGGRRRYPTPLQDDALFDEPPSWEETGDDDWWVAEEVIWHPAEERCDEWGGWYDDYAEYDDWDWWDDLWLRLPGDER